MVRKAPVMQYSDYSSPDSDGIARSLLELLHDKREVAVRAALYGMEPHGNQFKPGLEAVEEREAMAREMQQRQATTLSKEDA